MTSYPYYMNTPMFGAYNWNNNFSMPSWNNMQFDWSQPVWTQGSASTSSGAEKKKTFQEIVAEEKLKIKQEELEKEYKLEELKKTAEEEKKNS